MSSPSAAHIVVTGGQGGLGGAVVARLRASGAIVHVPDRTALDVGSDASVRAFYGALPSLWASVHLVGGFSMAPLLDTDVSSLRAQWELNTVSAFLCTREAARRMQPPAGSGGRIVNVAARPALVATAGVSAYAASKAAVVSLTQTAALELKPFGILVNAVAPSTIDTPKNRADMPDAEFTRWPKPEEIAETVAWLVSPANTLVSGAVVPVYGRA